MTRRARDDATARRRAEEVAAHYRWLADEEFAGYCEIYRRIADRAAGDIEFCALVASVAEGPRFVPVLLFACVHDLVLRDHGGELAACYRGETDRDPWPLFRGVVLDHRDELVALARRRSIQTNEVGRAALVLPVLAALQARTGRPLAVVEVGASAGLNLFADRFHVDYGSASCGDPASTVRLRCELRGDAPVPIPASPPVVVRRLGLDLAPLDVTDAEDRRWLEACLWPLVPDRAERLRAAIAIARQEPPEIRAGDAVALVGPALAELPGEVLAVVVSTWVLAYLPRPQRGRLHEVLAGAGATRDLAVVTLEYPGVAPWVPDPARPPTPVGPGHVATDVPTRSGSLLGIARWERGTERAAALAWAQAHGGWLDWLGEPV